MKKRMIEIRTIYVSNGGKAPEKIIGKKYRIMAASYMRYKMLHLKRARKKYPPDMWGQPPQVQFVIYEKLSLNEWQQEKRKYPNSCEK